MKSLYEILLETMDANRDKEAPCVGIFGYHPIEKKLFGTIKKTIHECKQTSKITCSELHKYIWKKEFNKQKYKNNGIGPYHGDWKDTPRGRIFYDVNENQYIICVGSWIKDHTDAIDLIVDEFHLNEVDYDFQIEKYWEIGMSWGD